MPNPGVKRSAKQRGRCLVPVALRAPAPAYAERYAALAAGRSPSTKAVSPRRTLRGNLHLNIRTFEPRSFS